MMESAKTDRETVLKAVYAALDVVNRNLPDDRQLPRKEQIVLYGSEGVLDSLELVNVIVAVEQQVDKICGVCIVLADERAMSQKNSPFRSIATLVDYTTILVQEKVDG